MKRSAITRTVLLLSFVSMFADIASEMLYPVVPGYLKSIGFDVLLIGILEGTAELIAGVSKGMFGEWSDRLGKRAVFVRTGYFLGSVSKPLMAMFAHPLWIFGVRTIDRLGKGMRSAPRDALLSLQASPGTKAQVFGFHRGMDTLGAVIGPLLAMVLVQFFRLSLPQLFVIAFVPGLISVTLTFTVRDSSEESLEKAERKTISGSKRPSLIASLRYLLHSPLAFKQLLRPILLFSLFNSSDMFLLLFVTEKFGGTQSAITAYIVYNISLALSAYPLGRVADVTSLKYVVAIGVVLVGVMYTLLPFSSSFTEVIILFVVYGVGYAAFESTAKAWVSSVVPREEIGSAMGMFSGAQSIALLCAGVVTGTLWHINMQFALALTGGIAVTSALWIALMRDPVLSSKEKDNK